MKHVLTRQFYEETIGATQTIHRQCVDNILIVVCISEAVHSRIKDTKSNYWLRETLLNTRSLSFLIYVLR